MLVKHHFQLASLLQGSCQYNPALPALDSTLWCIITQRCASTLQRLAHDVGVICAEQVLLLLLLLLLVIHVLFAHATLHYDTIYTVYIIVMQEVHCTLKLM
jgi:hypothetical protein